MTDEELCAIREEVRQITAFIESQRAAFAGSVWWREDAIGITAAKHATALLAEVERLRKLIDEHNRTEAPEECYFIDYEHP